MHALEQCRWLVVFYVQHFLKVKYMHALEYTIYSATPQL